VGGEDPLTCARIIVDEDRSGSRAPLRPKAISELNPDAGAGLKVADVIGPRSVLGDDPEGVADQPVTDGRLPGLAAASADGLEHRVSRRHNTEPEQPDDRRVEHVTMQGLHEAKLHSGNVPGAGSRLDRRGATVGTRTISSGGGRLSINARMSIDSLRWSRDVTTYRVRAAGIGARIACYTFAILALGLATSTPSVPLATISAAGALGLVAFCELRAARVRLVVTPSEVIVRNALGSVLTARSDVDHFGVEKVTSRGIEWTHRAAVMVTKSGRRVPITALPVSAVAGRASRGVISRLNAALGIDVHAPVE